MFLKHNGGNTELKTKNNKVNNLLTITEWIYYDF